MPSSAVRERAATDPSAVAGAGRLAAGGPASRVTRTLDLAVLAGLALFATWTGAYLLALAGAIPSAWAFWGWVALGPVVVIAVRRSLAPTVAALPVAGPWVPLAVSAVLAGLAAVIVRFDLDDASYVVRSTWIAAHGDVRVGDVIFSGGRWPGLPAQTPYLPSIEALLGWVSRVTGLSVGDVAYVLLPPLATAGAVWALWMLLRAWRVRRPAVGLLLAALFLVLGGATHASWGNLHLARMWQGKVLFLAIVVPLLYAACAWLWAAGAGRERRAAMAVVGLASVAAVGLTPAAVFVVPGVVLAGSVPGALRRQWADVGRLLAIGAGPALAAGAVMLVAGGTGQGGFVPGAAGEDAWEKVLGTGLPAVVALAAAVVLIAGCLLPEHWATCAPEARWTALAAVAAGLLIAVPALYALAGSVMGTDAIAWRLTWIVPVPALVALLGGVPGRVKGGVVAVGAAAALLVGGLPLWSPLNGATVAAPGTWELPAGPLAAARWAAAEASGERVLAPVDVVAALGVVQPDARPVSSRGEYLEVYADRPGARVATRLLLQRLVEGGTDPADLARAPEALTTLDVGVVCHRTGLVELATVLEEQGMEVGYTGTDDLVCRVPSA
ncbi:DUF6077 domain-containing protein [Modestobacter sp. VKM Ac-2980]|uniref:DUF6077 domain-containing protein n=1 Tax=unclassified Modestobacter TaxID=2643866 RepID=UPI0022AB7297|nr:MULTISPECIES: DUF6077 domain-containing protein [unclassified Modestobacter]MCZ2841238.1 DUF6077 domain-containing protein [Modestobacter sp. VKM Ac-2980]